MSVGDQFYVELDDLRQVRDRLDSFIKEFDDIGASSDRVEDAVGRPAGDGRLRDRVSGFEAGWDGNRKVVKDSLDDIHSHIKDFIDSVEETDKRMTPETQQ